MIYVLILIFTLVPHVLTMNPISALGYSALWKNHRRNQPSSAISIQKETPLPSVAAIQKETPLSSPIQVIDNNQLICSPPQSCINNFHSPTNDVREDTPKSIENESIEEHDETSTSPPPAMTLEECLEEKARIDHLLGQRAKLGPFLIESTERPVINNMTEFKASAEAIRSDSKIRSRCHLYDDVDSLVRDFRAYELNRLDVLAIRLYTTAISYVVNEALRNYSFFGIPIPTTYIPYIYALLNALAKLDSNRLTNEALKPILDLHQPGALVMYPAFTSTSMNDRAKGLWTEEFAVHPDEHEAVFPPGTIFHVTERDYPFLEMEEVMPKTLEARRAELPC
ncbi:hypothetical protein I4U23_003612 [Adineta vaga]|nr:hypothetical protein I4U23_003612 [Adineta vaga]